MLILALDSTALCASVALCRDEHLLAEYTVNTGHTHSETLLPMVESVLKTCGVGIDEIDLFACTAGPGSFTGVRIGAATIKGLAFGKGKPCIGVSTLDSLADNAAFLNGILCPTMNARRSQVYTALFSAENSHVTRLCPDRALSIAELADEVALIDPARPVYLMGDGALLTYDVFRAMDGLSQRTHLLPERLQNQSGYHTAQVAKRLYDSGVRTTDAELVPTYLRPSQAERVRAEQMQNT
jgi:tRNA threonylcarbamoyladenosine biosynthesis protein TsaB